MARLDEEEPQLQLQHHPSHQIPNAAYPDSSYRPGVGPTTSYQQHQQGSLQTHTDPGAAAAQIQPPPQAWHGDASDPPPPYDPSSRPSDIPLQDVRPPHPAATVDSGATTAGPSPVSPNQYRRLGAGSAFAHYTNTNTTVKPDTPRPYRTPAQLRRRKIKICALLFVAIIIFLGALLVGVGLGVWRYQDDAV